MLPSIWAGTAFATPEGAGQPFPWQMHFQTSVTEVMDFMTNFHLGLVVLITVITLFVLALLIYVMVRFNEKRNPVPSKTTHNIALEVAWTIVPVAILVFIAIPSFSLLKLQLVTPKPDITLKVTGHAWYWSYEYPEDQGGGFSFDSNMLDEPTRQKAIADGKPANEAPRLLAVDNEVIVPVNKNVRLQITAADVMHSFAMPSFGVKMDAIPGRLNESWFNARAEGIYFGQCSELCGQNHAFMPIAIRVVSEEAYKAWLSQAKQKFASTDETARAVASR